MTEAVMSDAELVKRLSAHTLVRKAATCLIFTMCANT